ncbi:MAG TPA: pyridoxamine 5'-phosphate oxidase family protein [Burkholderiaceae bacterium]|nr:pyridoxamine 5'-phosphate oxidase family protein [Burkholderiaceae bacterium]
MTLELPRSVTQYITSRHVMTLAAQGSDGPWAAAVFYASDGDDLIFVSSPASRHARQLALDARCAATIHSEVTDWRSIRGVQLEGSVDALAAAQRPHAMQVYGEKFPFVQPAVAAPAIAQALARVQWYRLRIARLYFLDNAQGFGRRQLFEA